MDARASPERSAGRLLVRQGVDAAAPPRVMPANRASHNLGKPQAERTGVEILAFARCSRSSPTQNAAAPPRNAASPASPQLRKSPGRRGRGQKFWWWNLPLDQLEDKIVELCVVHRVEMVFVDGTGVGGGWSIICNAAG